jgi:hypothetical protein
MKKLLIAFALFITLFPCQKETLNTTNNSNSVSWVENANINFTAFGAPV